jgi:nicotinate-nucleotide pyrophosphorylase (carboxylating)
MMIALNIVDAIVDRAFEEDLAGGDLTTEACVGAEVRAVATAVARKPLVACGGAVFARVFTRFDPEVEVELLAPDGVTLAKDAVLWRVRGRARSLLSAERTALNLTQRMSGIATLARAYVDALPKGSRTRVVDTRKTTPGLRALERYAVRVGGAHNHRNDLGSAVLIKDNHIIAAGGIEAAISRARERAPHTSKIECEVASLGELEEGDVIKAVARVETLGASRPLLEVSGGITFERIAELGAVGVDVISVGALTHSAPAADIALDLALA